MKYYKVPDIASFNKDSCFIYKVEDGQVYWWDGEKHSWQLTVFNPHEFNSWEEIPEWEAFVDLI